FETGTSAPASDCFRWKKRVSLYAMMAQKNRDAVREIYGEYVLQQALIYLVSMSFNFGSGDGALQLQQIMPRMYYTTNADCHLQKGSSLPPVSNSEAFYGRGLSLYEESSSLCNGEEEASGGHAEKKRRLSVEQVRLLEMSFQVESKLEPEKKTQLAAELGLQQRQVAVWFQNRRARWKTKQLEREYDQLKLQYDAVLSEKEKLRSEVARLKQELKDAGKCRAEEEERENDKDQPAITITSSDCCYSEDTAILITPQNNSSTAEEEEEEETQQIVGNHKAAEKIQQTMSTASFCSRVDSNRRQVNDEENKEKLQNLLYPNNYCDDLYYDWLTFCSHAKP
ncbi:hypothetical protein KI387_022545, partial [Taxus chinensis]